MMMPIRLPRHNREKCEGRKDGTDKCDPHKHDDLDGLPIPTKDTFLYLQNRQYGLRSNTRPLPLVGNYVCKQLPDLLREREYKLGDINKIFSSHWVSDRQVVFGTKCNKLIVMDLLTQQKAVIPSLKSTPDSQPADCPCGIHGISINPSKTLLATGGESTNDLAVYKLPTFDPVCVGEMGHTDWIFDVQWLDDEFVVTGSRDNSMALWCIKEDEMGSALPNVSEVPEYGIVNPVSVRVCKRAEKVRAMTYNPNTQELVALSLNAYLHLWDANKFIQKMSHKLVHMRENVCLGMCEYHNLYGVGSQSHVALVDPRSLKQINHIVAKQRGCGIRSIQFKDDLMTIGSGSGTVYFYDLRAGKFLDHDCGHVLTLATGKGYLKQDETYRDYFYNTEYPNAVYTHCWDESGTKLFAAGGPLPAGLWGNYAGQWA